MVFVLKCFDLVDVIFDGYASGPIIKYHAHLKLTKGKRHLTVSFASTKIARKKGEFLTKLSKKSNVIKVAAGKFVEEGCQVQVAKGDTAIFIRKYCKRFNRAEKDLIDCK